MWQRHSCFLKEKQHKKHQHTSELHKSALLTITKQLQRSTWIFVYLRVLLAPAHTHTPARTHTHRHSRCEFVIVFCCPLCVAFRYLAKSFQLNCTQKHCLRKCEPTKYTRTLARLLYILYKNMFIFFRYFFFVWHIFYKFFYRENES